MELCEFRAECARTQGLPELIEPGPFSNGKNNYRDQYLLPFRNQAISFAPEICQACNDIYTQTLTFK